MIPPEDASWADSCLIKDLEESDTSWNSMKEALKEALDPQTDAPPQLDVPPLEISSSSWDEPSDGKTDDFWSRYDAKDIFLPTYNESLRDLGSLYPDTDISITDFQAQGQAEDDIFKVWDLGVPPEEEEGDFVKQLNKAFEVSPLQPTDSVPDHSMALEGSRNSGSIDDLVSGIADLSLSPDSPSL